MAVVPPVAPAVSGQPGSSPPPTITSITPNYGSANGGADVTIRGTNFDITANTTQFVTTGGGTVVSLESIDCVSPTECTGTTVKLPAGHGGAFVGPVYALVGGQQSPQFVLFGAYGVPVLQSLTPTSGPAAGGTQVQLLGNTFPSEAQPAPGPVRVMFGRTAIDLERGCESLFTCTVNAPPGEGTVDVTIITPGGTSNVLSYRYTAPAIADIAPNSGPAGGGSTVTITGSGFSTGTNGTRFVFDSGANALVNVKCNSSTSCIGTTVGVTLAAGQASTLPVFAEVEGERSGTEVPYTWYAVPVLTGLQPASGPESGGNAVTLTGGAFPDGGSLLGVVRVSFGASQFLVPTCQLSSACTVTAPQGSGTVPVTITTPGGTSSAQSYTYNAPPAIASITPNFGPAGGGTAVTIAGSGFSTTPGATQFVFPQGTDAFTNVQCSSSMACTATSVSVSAGPGAVFGDRIFAQVGVPSSSGVNFTWYGPPLLDSLQPAAGPAAGGNQVTLSGQGFPSGSVSPGPATLTFGGTAINLPNGCGSGLACAVTAPAGNGTVQVTITTPGGTSGGLAYTYLPPPSVTAISPIQGPRSGGTVVTITGTSFSTAPGATTVSFGSAPATNVSCSSATMCSATSPPGAGTVSVSVSVFGQSSADTPVDDFAYVGAPSVTGLSPNQGAAGGGATVTISGAGFSTQPGATAATFGTAPATNVNCASATSCVATSPAGAGTVSVRVTVAGQTSADTPADDFTYLGLPAITGIAPGFGPAGGGAPVTITGANFSTAPGGTRFVLGGGGDALTNVSCATSAGCTATSANLGLTPGQALTTEVYALAAGVRSSGSVLFTWYAPPVLQQIQPAAGPVAGGNQVTLLGDTFPAAGFSPGSASVSFGIAVISLPNGCQGPGGCTVTAPAGSGTVNVTITTPGGASNTVQYTYVPLPVVTGLSPTAGPAAGGTVVTITGANLTSPLGPTSVAFGTGVATNVSCSSAAQCTATSPAGQGTVSVRVTAGGQTSVDAPADDFTYIAAPVVTGVAPNAGLAAGGEMVTVTGSGFSTVAGGTSITFGGVAATNVQCAKATSCTAVTPPGMGTVSVLVTVGGQTSPPNAQARYSYVTPTAQAMTVIGGALLDGTAAPAGTLIQALIGATVCGEARVGAGGEFSLQVVAAAELAGCGTSGATVSFVVAGRPAQAQPPVTFTSGGLAKTNLTAATAPLRAAR